MESLLFYTSVGKDRSYLECLEYFCQSLMYNHRCVVNLLVICDASMQSDVHAVVRKFAFLNAHVHSAPDALTSVEASKHKLRFFSAPCVWRYRVALFVDLDCLFLRDMTYIFRHKLLDNRLYVYPERATVDKNFLTWFSLAHPEDEKRCWYSEDDVKFLYAKHKLPFNAGLFLFRITPLMEQHFDALNNFVRNFRGSYFYEQSFMNTYFHLADVSDFSLFNTDNIQMVSNTNETAPGHTLIHFNSAAGDGRLKKDLMRAYWTTYLSEHPLRQEVFDTRNAMVEALIPYGATILEIGVFKGEFAEVLLARNPKQLYLVDMWDDGPVGSGDVDGNNFTQEPSGAALCDKVLHRYRFNPNVSVCKLRSDTFLPLLADASLDVVYIDGDHSYEGVKRDLELVWPKMRCGGWIMGHDYEMNMAKARTRYEFGVKRAVDEFCAAHNLSIYAKGLDGCVSYAIFVPIAGTAPQTS